MKIRSPIVSVLGHVDHGKTTLLDFIRGSFIAQKEAGGITQHIGATEIPMDAIESICSQFIQKLEIRESLPGLFFIDTPGHEAFTTLRKRGGALADLAVLMVDLNEGFKPQTYEALNILKMYQTPFVVGANKMDRIPGWQVHEEESFSQTYNKQTPRCKPPWITRSMSWWESSTRRVLNPNVLTGCGTSPDRSVSSPSVPGLVRESLNF